MYIGYARVSKFDQNLDRQIDQLNNKAAREYLKKKLYVGDNGQLILINRQRIYYPITRNKVIRIIIDYCQLN